MKKSYFLLALMSLVMVSCEDFLNTEPIDKVAAEQFYTDEAGIMQGLASVYDPLAVYYGNNINTTFELCSDESYHKTSTQTGIATNSFNSADGNVAGLWTACYLGILRANDLIAHINVPQMDETKRQNILGEALFLRGYYYFILVTHYGSVPVMKTPTTSPNDVYVKQSPINEVYAEILSDMKEAETKVATATTLGFAGRVSKTAVQGILARVCLTMAGAPLNDTSKYAEAISWAKKVQSSGEVALRTTVNTSASWSYNVYTPTNPSVKSTLSTAYSQIFITAAQDLYDTKESMWEIEFQGDRAGQYNELGGLGSQIGINSGNLVLGWCWGFTKASSKLYKIYQPGDLRRDWNITTFTFTGAANAENPITSLSNGYGRDAAKWRRLYEKNTATKDKNQTAINFPVLRYADVLLMLAEAENKVNGPTQIAYDAINQVRRRGYGLNINTVSAVADLPGGQTQATFQQNIEDERMRELCFEGLRKMDLIRWNKYPETMAAMSAQYIADNQAGAGFGAKNTLPRNVLYPIPLKELSINHNLVQNPGW